MSPNGDLEVAEMGIGQVQSPKTENFEKFVHQNQKIIPPCESTQNSSPFQKTITLKNDVICPRYHHLKFTYQTENANGGAKNTLSNDDISIISVENIL